ncbi:MAG: ion transporter [Muribaculaceae bacterium]|nr:ion transporter [Muribaculaceae bacterium]
MPKVQDVCKRFVYGKAFDFFITIVIIVNSVLIGVQTTDNNATIEAVQRVILYIFTIECVLRFLAAGNLKDYLSSSWNVFDLVLVIIGWIPPSITTNSSAAMALRVLRVFRVLRLLRTANEIKLIISVLIKSMRSLLYNGILFLIFMYLFAVAGVSMFRLPNPDTLKGEELERYEQLMERAPHSPSNSPDPYGSIGEGFFTLFRALTGEDWTDLRYNLITAADYKLISVSPSTVTIFHVTWFCLAAFLLLNLVTGAVINNYQVSIEEEEKRRKNKGKTQDENPQ